MKSILIAASLVGIAVAGVIIYFNNRYLPENKMRDQGLLGNRTDGQERSMKYTMG